MTKLSRRSLLKTGAAAAAASALPAPMIWAQNIKNVTLRQFGTGVSNLNEVAAKVKEDLGFTLEMTALDSDSVTQRAATQPDCSCVLTRSHLPLASSPVTSISVW